MCPDITKYEIYLNAPDARAYRKICLDGKPRLSPGGRQANLAGIDRLCGQCTCGGPPVPRAQSARGSARWPSLGAPCECTADLRRARLGAKAIGFDFAALPGWRAAQWVDDRVGSADLVVIDAPPHAETE